MGSLSLYRSVPLVLAACASAPSTTASSTTAPSTATATVAYVGGTVIPSPDAAPIADGVVLTAGDRITAVGSRATTPIPSGARVVDCHGATVVAGLWNSHLHFTQPAFLDPGHAAPQALEAAVAELTSRWGFTHVVDLGSMPGVVETVRARIARGELRGPAIQIAGGPFVTVGGQPIYVKEVTLPVIATPAEGKAAAEQMFAIGADHIKLMTASVVASPPPPVMPVEVVRAVTDVAHDRHALVFAHPTFLGGVLAARDGGVDVLAHTAPASGPWTPALAASLVAAHMALIPTLALWRQEIEAENPAVAERYETDAISQVRAFVAAGGTLVFGTDAGYRPELDPTPEHKLLARAGLTFAQRLAMLTTAPAAVLGVAHAGQIAPGFEADLAILDGDPTADPAAFARVRLTVHDGAVIYARPTSK